jgi:hypothetical protein
VFSRYSANNESTVLAVGSSNGQLFELLGGRNEELFRVLATTKTFK